MVKRSTWIVLALLTLVVGAYFLIKNLPKTTEADQTPTATVNTYLFSETDGLLMDLRIFDGVNVFEMQRNQYNQWAVILPVPGAADQGLAGAAESQVGALLIVTKLETPPALSDMGLSSAAYTIRFQFDGNVTHKLTVGNLTPTRSGYYVQFDDADIYIISQAGIDALLNLLAAPPYPATSTPTLEPTATATPELNETATPESANPTP